MDDRSKQRILNNHMRICRHFTGVQHKECSVGVAYESVRDISSGPYKFACFKDERPELCSHASFPTQEEAEAYVLDVERRTENVMTAMRAVQADAKRHGYGKGRGGQGAIACPSCEGGTLRYSVAGYNGHIWGNCSTPGCAKWMQ